MPKVFYRVIVRRVRRQKQHPAACRFDQFDRSGAFVKGGIVQDNDLARDKFRQQHLFHPGVEYCRVAASLKHQGREDVVPTSGGDEADPLPFASRHFSKELFPPQTAAVFVMDAVVDPALIQVNKVLFGRLDYFFSKEPSFLLIPFLVKLLLFLRVMPSFLKALKMAVALTRNSLAYSTRVASVLALT